MSSVYFYFNFNRLFDTAALNGKRLHSNGFPNTFLFVRMKTSGKLESLFCLLFFPSRLRLQPQVGPSQANEHDLVGHLVQRPHNQIFPYEHKCLCKQTFRYHLLILDTDTQGQKLYGTGNTIKHVIAFEICSFVLSFLNCGNNSIRRYLWADLYAKLFLPPPTGRGYPSSNIKNIYNG